MTFSELIECWPTVAEFARDVNQNLDAAKKWKQRNSIPASHWIAVTEAANRRGIDISIESLAAMSQAKAA